MFLGLYQSLYAFVWWLATPLLKHHLQKRVCIGKEDRNRLDERFGIAGQMRPAGKLVWLHGASVGESIALLTIVARLRAEPNPPTVLVTTGTVTSAKIMQDRLSPSCIHQYLPLDRKAWVERFLNHWQPDGVIWSESEIWPQVFTGLKKRRIPSVIVNIRMSEKTVRNWSLFKPWLKDILSVFANSFAQTERDKRNWEALGGPQAQLFGNLKFVVPELPFDVEAMAVLHGEIGNRPLWVFSSIHPTEEMVGAEVHRVLSIKHPDLLTVIIPRHPQRGNDFADSLRKLGLNVAQRSKQQKIKAETQVYLADTIGELGLFYRLSKIVVIGGSFMGHGGQNPIEPAKLKAAVLYGFNMKNFTGICAAFEQGKAVIQVQNAAELADKIDELLQHPDKAARLGEKAYEVAQSEAGSLDKIWAAIAGWRARVLG